MQEGKNGTMSFTKIPENLLRSTLKEQYDLIPTTLELLPMGLDYNAAVYHMISEQVNYLLKVTSRPLYEPSFQVPDYLNEQGITSVVA
ncbi:hypothetical protein [Paenibacillus sp. UNC496MF]|uniref:hypothetical protein n=1 Tax=Paenibacillus sp. UNC496MF TaxID=1502753 RepID=UPI001C4332E9|nr:hypothetical protein [Paenibacillus sp. UNC496MF]